MSNFQCMQEIKKIINKDLNIKLLLSCLRIKYHIARLWQKNSKPQSTSESPHLMRSYMTVFKRHFNMSLEETFCSTGQLHHSALVTSSSLSIFRESRADLCPSVLHMVCEVSYSNKSVFTFKCV